jgi:signal transduction histidine kinase/CheY-like chemotaxis protein
MKFTFERKMEPVLYAVIAGLVLLPFFADLFMPLGTAVWVIYLLPIVLAYLVSRPLVPPGIAAIATVLVVLGFVLAPPGVDPDIAQVNRALGLATAWVMGLTGYFFIKNKLAVRTEEWLQAGQVGLADITRGEQRLDELGDNILRFLATYLDARAGVLFIQDGNAFHRVATYGVPADARVPAAVTPGDGLLGQAIKDGRDFLVSKVPDDYLYFGSSLGQTKPRHLLISPAKADGEINAVVELGLTERPNEAALELLERLAEAIGMTVRSAKYRQRLQELLEETQQQAEELQQQSEELRAANEELEEQSRVLRESQTRLETQQAELEQTNTQLEEQTQLLEAQRDDLGRTQAELATQARELERASRYKSEFLANMSHELRTPLNSLLIMARLLADNRHGNLTADEVKYAETIETSGNDLLTLINDILDISKIEAGRLDLQPHPVRIAHIVEKLTATFEATAAEKRLALRSEIAADAPVEIETDPQRLEQVLKNFLSNAVKFTERGEVVVGVAPRGMDRIGFTVRDTGIGIPAAEQEAIFEAFRQADGTISRKYGGTGLGLSISRELARLLGGDIEVESTLGEGSAFTLVIPRIYDPAHVAPRATPVIGGSPGRAEPMPLAGPPFEESISRAPARRQVEDDRERLSGDSRIILVVEDDAAFARILRDLAHELGFQCLVGETAEEGLLLARQYLPHAVILDVALPDHTGLSVLDRLKHDTRTRHIPVHVVSVSDYTQTALSLGAAGYMLKPVKREKLVQALEGLETHLAQRLRRVLIVEDDADQLESVRLLLASRDVETVGARTAATALEQLKAETFDCMVLDLRLPDVSGFDLLDKLSRDEVFAFPPVIVYTGRDLTPDEELRLRKFSKSIIIKGAKSPERLLDEVTLFLHQVVAELPEKQQKMLAKALNRDAVLEGRRVLVVEDDVRNVFALTSVFEPHGAAVQIARNGREAIEALERTGNGAPPIDLVLMDIMMPEMDGLTATRHIRSRSQWRNLPIIALTAKATTTDHEQCLAAGANDYLAKPLDVDKLLSLVRVWMPR